MYIGYLFIKFNDELWFQILHVHDIALTKILLCFRGKLRDTVLDWEDELPYEDLQKSDYHSKFVTGSISYILLNNINFAGRLIFLSVLAQPYRFFQLESCLCLQKRMRMGKWSSATYSPPNM